MIVYFLIILFLYAIFHLPLHSKKESLFVSRIVGRCIDLYATSWQSTLLMLQLGHPTLEGSDLPSMRLGLIGVVLVDWRQTVCRLLLESEILRDRAGSLPPFVV